MQTNWHIFANSVPNYSSLLPYLVEMQKTLLTLRNSNKIEQLPANEVPDTVISPMDQVSKPNLKEIQLIHDLSVFVNKAVEVHGMSFPTIETFLKWVSPGAFM
jgi:hypothetical protein